MINQVEAILSLHRNTVRMWHESEIDNPYDGFLQLACLQHEQNFRLWHQEDIARSHDVSDAELAEVKRSIDGFNQRRNDLIERMDDWVVQCLTTRGITALPEARLNTETPGSAIDRLSILSLRIYHMEEQANRADADEEHRAKAWERLRILHEQHHDLSQSLRELLDDLFARRKYLKVYRQFKMYNDPTMNPYLYRPSKKPAA